MSQILNNSLITTLLLCLFYTSSAIGNPSMPVSACVKSYKEDLKNRLAMNWTSVSSKNLPVILITIDHSGNLVETALFESTDDQKIDKAALYAATITEYAPLPDWYKGHQITFKINMSSIQLLKNESMNSEPIQDPAK